MTKLISICYTGNGDSSKSYAYQKNPILMIFKYKDLKDGIFSLRKSIKQNFVLFLNKNLACTREYRYHLSISIYDKDLEEIRFKNFTIDPKNLK